MRVVVRERVGEAPKTDVLAGVSQTYFGVQEVVVWDCWKSERPVVSLLAVGRETCCHPRLL